MFLGALAQLSALSPAEWVKGTALGINLGNTLDAPTEGRWAKPAEQRYFDLYKSAGFKAQFYGDKQSICGSTWRRAVLPQVAGAPAAAGAPTPLVEEEAIRMTGVDAALRFKRNLLGSIGRQGGDGVGAGA